MPGYGAVPLWNSGSHNKLRHPDAETMEQVPGRRVALVLRYVHQYRLPFFLRLHDQFMRAGVDLKVIY